MTPNMNSLRAISAALVIGCSVNSVSATDIERPQELIQVDQIGQDWTFIEQINGIAVSYSMIVLNDERFLSVQFENTNPETVDFIWSMTKNNASIRITGDEMIESRIQLTSYTSEIVDGTYLIEMTNEDQFSDFIVSIKPTKH